jgi:hypothetical protein
MPGGGGGGGGGGIFLKGRVLRNPCRWGVAIFTDACMQTPIQFTHVNVPFVYCYMCVKNINIKK